MLLVWLEVCIEAHWIWFTKADWHKNPRVGSARLSLAPQSNVERPLSQLATDRNGSTAPIHPSPYRSCGRFATTDHECQVSAVQRPYESLPVGCPVLVAAVTVAAEAE